MKAVELKELDTMYHIHFLAFSNFRAKATKKSGKNKVRPVYTSFKKFFDYESELNRIMNKKEDKFARVKQFLKKRGGNANG